MDSSSFPRPPLWSSGQSSGQSRGPGSIPGATRFFLEEVGLERGPLSFMSTIEELLGRKNSGSFLGNRDYDRMGSAALTTRHSFIRKS
jgi:hypothetical protein